MPARIVSTKFINMQSWDERHSTEIPFIPDLLNVIKGKSETGKSVYYKVIYQMVFPDKYRNTYKDENKTETTNDLIRAGETEAYAEYLLDNGTIIKFYLFHTTQHFEMHKVGEEPKVYYEQEMPKEIIEEFGLIVDKNLKFILNVLTKEHPYPFVSTAETWNADVLNIVFSNEELENAMFNLNAWVKETSSKLVQLDNGLRYRKYIDADLKYVDEEDIRLRFTVINEIAEMYDKLDDLRSTFKELADSQARVSATQYKAYNIVEINEIKELYITLCGVQESLEKLKEVNDQLDSLPKLQISSAQVGQYTSIAKSMFVIQKLLTDSIANGKAAESLKSEIETKRMKLQAMESVIGKVKEITEYSNKLGSVSQVVYRLFQSYIEVISANNSLTAINTRYSSATELLNKALELVEYDSSLRKIQAHFTGHIENIILAIGLGNKKQEVEQKLKDIIEAQGVCPVCNRPFEGGVSDGQS